MRHRIQKPVGKSHTLHDSFYVNYPEVVKPWRLTWGFSEQQVWEQRANASLGWDEIHSEVRQ